MKKLVYCFRDKHVEIEMPDYILPLISELISNKMFKIKIKKTKTRGVEHSLIVCDDVNNLIK